VGVAHGTAVVVSGCSVTWVWDGPGFGDRARPTISPSVRRLPRPEWARRGCRWPWVPEHEERTRALDLPAKRPVLRFDVGPTMKQDSSGRYYDTGEEILHMWVPRR
jgi:hypothetical protein